MKRFWAGMFPAAALPATTVVLIALPLWLWASHKWNGGPTPQHPLIVIFFGWLEFLMVLVTVTAIVWTSAVPNDKGTLNLRDIQKSAIDPHWDADSGRKILLGFALLGDVTGLLIAFVGISDVGISWRDVGQLFVLLSAWSALWCAAAWALRRWGAGFSVGIPLLLSILLIAAPVVMMPMVHASAHWGQSADLASNAQSAPTVGPWQGRLTQTIGVTSPMLASLDAIRPAITIDWTTLPGMYEMSALDQDVPMRITPWWINSSIYAGLAALIWIAVTLRRARQTRIA